MDGNLSTSWMWRWFGNGLGWAYANLYQPVVDDGRSIVQLYRLYPMYSYVIMTTRSRLTAKN